LNGSLRLVVAVYGERYGFAANPVNPAAARGIAYVLRWLRDRRHAGALLIAGITRNHNNRLMKNMNM